MDTRTSYSAGFVPATNAAEPYWASTKGPNSLKRRARKNTSTTLSGESEYTVCGLARSSLTELFAPEIHKKRLENWPQHYPWIEPEGYQYFRKRLSEARRDVEHGLQTTLDHFKSRQEQERALEILQFKLDVLWTMLDTMQLAYGIGKVEAP